MNEELIRDADLETLVSDEAIPLVTGMTPRWQSVYDRLREAHALAMFDAQIFPEDPEVLSILSASTSAVQAFRQAYLQNFSHSHRREEFVLSSGLDRE